MSSWARATTTSQTALGLEHFAARQQRCRRFPIYFHQFSICGNPPKIWGCFLIFLKKPEKKLVQKKMAIKKYKIGILKKSGH